MWILFGETILPISFREQLTVLSVSCSGLNLVGLNLQALFFDLRLWSGFKCTPIELKHQEEPMSRTPLKFLAHLARTNFLLLVLFPSFLVSLVGLLRISTVFSPLFGKIGCPTSPSHLSWEFFHEDSFRMKLCLLLARSNVRRMRIMRLPFPLWVLRRFLGTRVVGAGFALVPCKNMPDS